MPYCAPPRFYSMSDEILLNEAADAVWKTVKERGPIELNRLAFFASIDQAQASAVATEAAEQGFFSIEVREREQIIASPSALELIRSVLPEIRAAFELERAGGKMKMAEFAAWAKSDSIQVNEAIKWGTARGWFQSEKDAAGKVIVLTQEGRNPGLQSDLRAVEQASKAESLFLDELPERMGVSTDEVDRIRTLLCNRPELAKIKKRTERIVSITAKGVDVLEKRVRVVKERNTLTPEDIESGAWREIKLRPYDVTLAAKDVYPSKIHPLRKIIEQTRRAFLEMGFAEVASPMIESAFWNFDALFQPQDHPARDMQDTFYMRHPALAPLPGEANSPAILAGHGAGKNEPGQARPGQDGPAISEIVEHVRRTHEDGWETGSEGWGYTWSPERSRQVVLRTHTTAATIRALAANPNPPGKFFCVGWTYRNETISFKHLPVFHQVDGIIVDEEANLASLMGTLQEFYSKMGFGRVKFKPAFYPYTEPSVDVVVYMESRGKWLEMGGAGIFRPEVTLPLGCKYPVLAWGLGIERLAMLRFGLSDIRELYRPSLDALEGVPLWR
jgi:phenylalanyl-tRNA synthetase alpha chain